MSVDTQPRDISLSDRVAEEVRVLLVRKRMTGRELARRLDVSPAWLSYRLTGTQPFDINDMERIAEALGVSVVDLLPAGLRRVTTHNHPDPADTPTPKPAIGSASVPDLFAIRPRPLPQPLPAGLHVRGPSAGSTPPPAARRTAPTGR